MGWNHRILAHKDNNNWYFQIHEVYYDKEGKPNSYTANGVSVGAESIEGINWVLDKMKECTNKPILSVDNFPNEWSSNGGITDECIASKPRTNLFLFFFECWQKYFKYLFATYKVFTIFVVWKYQDQYSG